MFLTNAGFIKSYFDSFYNEEIITEESFNAWESGGEEEQGKGVAIATSSEFFRWLGWGGGRVEQFIGKLNNRRGKPRGADKQYRCLHCSPLKLGIYIYISFLDRGPFCIILAERSFMINVSLAPSVRARTSSSRFQSRVKPEILMKIKDDDRVAIARVGPSQV